MLVARLAGTDERDVHGALSRVSEIGALVGSRREGCLISRRRGQGHGDRARPRQRSMSLRSGGRSIMRCLEKHYLARSLADLSP